MCWFAGPASLSGLDPNSGKVHWSHPMKPVNMPIGIATPSVDGDLIYVSSFYDGSLMVRAPLDELTSEVVWRAIGRDEKNTDALQLPAEPQPWTPAPPSAILHQKGLGAAWH